jgi:hypothetical protein
MSSCQSFGKKLSNGALEMQPLSNSSMQGLTIHDNNIIVLTMFLGYKVFVYICFVYKHWGKCRVFLHVKLQIRFAKSNHM